MHLGHVCTPGAAGIARAMPGEVVKSAPTIRLVSFHVGRTSQGENPPHDPCAKPALCRFSPGPFGTCSFMDLMGNPPQGGGIPLLDIGEQLATKAVKAARRGRMLAQRVDFHRFSTPSLATTCSLYSIIHFSACCVLEMR